MSVTLSVIVTILIIAAVIGIIGLICGLISSLIEAFSTQIWFVIKPFVYMLILISIWESRISINAFFSQHSFLTFMTNLLVVAFIFVFFPRKAIILSHKIDTSKHVHSATHYIDMTTGKFGSYGGGISYVTYDVYELLGSEDEKYYNKYDKWVIWDSDPEDGGDILSYNLVFKYGAKNVFDCKITNYFVCVYPFISVFWILFISALGGGAPHLMGMMIYPLLWFIFYEKKVYYSMAHGKMYGAKKWVYWVSIGIDLLICLLMYLVKNSNEYFEIALIYSIFIIVSSIVFYIKHREQ